MIAAQETLWAVKLLGFSSERRPSPHGLQYRAVQLLGAPDKLPSVGDSPCAWSPAEADGQAEEWVKVAFSKAIRPQQILIGENFNPGALTAVYVYDSQGNEYQVASERQLGRGSAMGRLLAIRPDPALSVDIHAVKIVMNPSKVYGDNQIDAIGITESAETIELTVAVADDFVAGMKKEPLSPSINSRGREIAPVVSPDGSTLYFTREHPSNVGSADKQDVWYSTLQGDGVWGAPENIGPPINNAGDNAVLGTANGGRTLYLINAYRHDGTMVEGFSKSHLTKKGWSFPQTIDIEDHYNDFRPKNTEMTISPDEQVIILSVQRKDTQGSKDLYVSFRKTANSWGTPINLGSVINTADYEGAPFLAADNKTLYFTSFGHRGFGSGDIFMSRRLDDSWLSWSKPLNLGPAVNSPYWDSFFTIPAFGEYAYMSSFNPDSQSDDLFRVPLYPSISPEQLHTLSGRVVDETTGEPLETKLIVRSEGADPFTLTIDTDRETGEFSLLLPHDSTFVVAVENKGYFPYTEPIHYASLTKKRLDISLAPIESGRKFALKQVQFAQSSAQLDAASLEELLKVAELMKTYPTMEILLEGHTDNQGDLKKNVLLSEARVKAVKRMLEQEGIDKARIQLKAWGPSRPLTHNRTEESRRQNRRVELTILKI